MRRKEDHLVGGQKYRVTQLPYKKARSLTMRLMKYIGEGASDMASIPANLNEDDLDYLEDLVFGEYCHWKNEQDDWVPMTSAFVEEHFDGKIGEYFQLLGICLIENISDFMSGLDVEALGTLMQNRIGPSQK